MRTTRNWKHTTRNRKQYGKRNEVKYNTPFMVLDENYLDDEEGGDEYDSERIG